jgi:probable HAF family extracellular repeat protein
MNQIKRIIRSNLGKALALSTFALSILVAASVAVASRESGSVEQRNRQSIVSSDLGSRGHGFVRNNNGGFTTIDAPDAEFFTLAFGIDGNGKISGGYVDGGGRLHGFLLDQDGFEVIDYPGAVATLAARVNDQGQIVGAYSKVPNTPVFSLSHGFLMHNGVFTSIDFPGARRTQPFGINNLGHIVGEYSDQGGRSHGFLWKNGVFETIDAPGSTSTLATDINDNGQIVGIDATGGQGFLRSTGGAFTSIGAPDAITQPFGINNNGQIVGFYTPLDQPRIRRGFLLDNGNFTDIVFPDDNPRTFAFDINDRGQIAGSYNLLIRGYLRDEFGEFTAIDAPNAVTETAPGGINRHGQIVGSFDEGMPGKLSGFRRDVSGIFTRIDFPGAAGTGATSINDLGQIVGIYSKTSPDPSSFQSNARGFLYYQGVFTRIHFPDARQTMVRDIDNNGRIVGDYLDSDRRSHGLLRDISGAFTTIDVPIPGAIGTSITGINDRGQMVGVYLDGREKLHGFLLDQGVPTTIDFPGALATQLLGINNNGQIVGVYIDNTRNQGFLWSNGTFIPINAPGAIQESTAFGIDDRGRIVGTYF